MRAIMSRAFLLVLLLFSLCAPSRTLSAQVLRTVIVGDLSPSAQWGKYTSALAMDLLNVSISIAENVPESQTDLTRLEIDEDTYSSPKFILDAVQELTVTPDDAILFYFTGHGAVDDRGHYLSLAQGKLYRTDLLAALLAKGARFVALITDCCNTRSDGYLYAAPYVQVQSPSRPSPLFEHLFFESKGVSDINSSSPGENAFFVPIQEETPGSPGSIFTGELTSWMHTEMRYRRNWDELVRAVSLRVHKAFRDFYPNGTSTSKGASVQTDQNVFAFQYPDMPPTEGTRTGLVVRDFVGRGAVIVEVAPNSPATQVFLVHQNQFASLLPQQVIVSVNGRPTPNTEAVVQALGESPQIMRLTVRDATRGTFEVLLRMKY
jgi:hypothetical protein